MKILNRGIFLALITFFVAGCASYKMTSPPRSATEQLLLSTAADRALASADLTIFANQTVFLDTTYFDSYDSKYAVGEIRDALSRAGALLETNANDANIIIEARSGALSTDSANSLIGIPGMGLPVPLTGTVSIPEIALYKSEKQRAYAKIALLAYANQSRAHIYSSGPLLGKTYNNYNKILFLSWNHSDVPEKETNPEKAEKYQSWFAHYDPTNMPSPVMTTNQTLANPLLTNSPVISPTNSFLTKTNSAANSTAP